MVKEIKDTILAGLAILGVIVGGLVLVITLFLLKIAFIVGFFAAIVWGILWVLRSQGVL